MENDDHELVSNVDAGTGLDTDVIGLKSDVIGLQK